ncbi:glycosyltransferase family 4 protein [Piscinibacter terrae]|uniref:Glycosyltransferase n=1 Tax=Piscinibacter terrae TaxID=2496871 RepID=A0A3N7HKP7_9BURK|nr:glycosyltransferase family 4 protein [Albitalea terrae]RQP22103.1 glycosyltransferase [Albitalea terrae]
MRVALYHPWIYLKSGLERTILEIAKRSRHEWDIYTSHYDAEGTYPELKQHHVQEVNRVSVQRSYGAVLGASMNIARTRLATDKVDALVVCCDGVGSFVTLRNGQVPAINLCFTPLRAVYDEEYRKRHLERQGGRRWMALLMEKGYRWMDRWLWRRYDRVVCISETVRDRSVAGGLGEAASMDVLYPGVDGSRIQASDTFEHFFFLPGRIMWTKNIELGIEAFLMFKRATGSDWKLVIAGMVDHKGQEYFARLKELTGGDDSITFHVGPSDAQMQDYYTRCGASLFTAFNEDLGLTPMEAMARGKPVIAVNRGGPREVVEHQVSGYLVNADPQSFSVAMELLTQDESRLRRMGQAGLERVKRFTWDKLVSGLDDVIDQAVAGRKR